MRHVYTSLRNENVDRVVELLNSHDIETTVVNRSSYNSADWKKFSYTQRPDVSTWPQVWVVNSNDQTRARELLREAGIEPPTRYADEIPTLREEQSRPYGPARHRSVANRARMAALAVVGVASVMLAIKSCSIGGVDPRQQQKPQPQKQQQQREVVPVTVQ